MAPKFLILLGYLVLYDYNGPFVGFLFYFGLFSWVVNHHSLYLRSRATPGLLIPYTPAYSAFTFPLVTTTSGTFKFYTVSGQDWVR
eukprot:451707-Prorocentrum_minimum.AAC.1